MKPKKVATDIQSRNGKEGPDDSTDQYKVAAELYPRLPTLELVIYAVVWVGSLAGTIAQIYYVSKDNEEVYLADGLLKPGWRILGGKLQDVSDSDWSMLMKYYWDTFVLGFTIHFIIARVADMYFPDKRFSIFAVYGAAFTAYFFGLHGLIFMLMHFAIQYLAAYLTKSVTICWMTGLLLCYSLLDSVSSEESHFGVVYSYLVKPFYVDEDRGDFLAFATAMCNLRYIGFSLEYVWAYRRRESVLDTRAESNPKITIKGTERQQQTGIRKRTVQGDEKKTDTRVSSTNEISISKFSFFDLLIYQFYFPLLYGGPILTYDKFVEETQKKPVVWSTTAIAKFIFGIIRFSFWILFMDFVLHYLYLASLSSEDRVVKILPPYLVLGLGHAQAGFFYMKNVIGYGLPSHIATSDNIVTSKVPTCPWARHRLTDMWKGFDRGLHKWLLRYIYFPCGGSRVNIYLTTVNSFLPFLFTAFWHGLDTEYVYWAVVTWAAVFTESLAFRFYKSETIQLMEAKYTTPAWSRRIRGLFSSIPCAMILSLNLYFQSGMEVGNAYWSRLYGDGIVFFHLVHYAAAQCSMELLRRQITSD